MKRIRTKMNLFDIPGIMLVVLLCLCFLCPPKAYAEMLQDGDLSLYKGKAEENMPFAVTNMLPGDSVTQVYRIRISYTGKVEVFFHITPETGDEILAEELIISVKLENADTTLYEGTLADMPELQYILESDQSAMTEEIGYEVNVLLSKTAGNAYQGKRMTAKLSWWADGDALAEPPHTGDDSKLLVLVVILIAAAIGIGFLLKRRNHARASSDAEMVSEEKRRKRHHIWFKMLIAVLMFIGLSVTSMALSWYQVTIEENLFSTGTVKVNLNNGKPVFAEDILFEPGMVIQKDFTISNEGSADVYFCLWFSDIDGKLADELIVEISDGEQTIFKGILRELLGRESVGAHGELLTGAEKELAIVVHLPQDCENDMQGAYASFDLNIKAVQKAHNEEMDFG